MSNQEETIRFSVSLPKGLLDELDRRLTTRGYASRSELVRDLIRERLVDEAWEQDREVMGVLTIVYDHHQRELTQKLIDVQHMSHIHVLCTTHVHMDHHNCLETIILRGRPQELEHIAIEIGGLRGVRYAKLTKAAPMAI